MDKKKKPLAITANRRLLRTNRNSSSGSAPTQLGSLCCLSSHSSSSSLLMVSISSSTPLRENPFSPMTSVTRSPKKLSARPRKKSSRNSAARWITRNKPNKHSECAPISRALFLSKRLCICACARIFSASVHIRVH